jgi:Kdo2-lipid IVA lauroyltransferase/acyltransferase
MLAFTPIHSPLENVGRDGLMAECGYVKHLRYRSEGVFVRVTLAFFWLLALDRASALGGSLARMIGPLLGISNRARVNLRRAMPELSVAEIDRIVRNMWDNLGRVVAEFPHLGQFRIGVPDSRVAIGCLPEIIKSRTPNTRYIFFSAHYGNWEIATYIAKQSGLDVVGVYRAANNPFVDRIINRTRGVIGCEQVPKGTSAALRVVGALAEGKHISMLVDQKMNDGIAVPFFGRDAMTAPALARLALRYDCVVLPCRVERVKGATFRLVIDDPIPLPRSGDAQADTLALMTAVNATVERWVRARPEQWLWLHRRWPD